MNYVAYILRHTPHLENKGLAFRSVALRLFAKRHPQPYAWKYQARLFVMSLLMLWSLPFRLRRVRARAIYYDNLTDERSQQRRKYFLAKHTGIPESQWVAFAGDRPFAKIYFHRLRLSTIWQVHRLAWRLVGAAFVGMFKPTRLHWLWKVKFANMALQQVIFHDGSHPQYLFFSYEQTTYLSSLLTSHLVRGFVPHIISSNSVLFSNNRYQYQPHAHYRLCSAFQEAEVASYQERGWMEFRSVELWGLEEAETLDAVPKSEAKVDIGVYSSGSWARNARYFRSGNIDWIREGKFHENAMYLQFLPMLEAVIAYKKATGASVKVYFHPFETMLYQQHDIAPPFLSLLDQADIQYEIDGKSSLENFYEARVGVAISSTILFDRMHYGLAALYYGGEGIPHFIIEPRYLGDYQQYCFQGPEELQMMLGKALEKV